MPPKAPSSSEMVSVRIANGEYTLREGATKLRYAYIAYLVKKESRLNGSWGTML
jgi:hypothetical protein